MPLVLALIVAAAVATAMAPGVAAVVHWPTRFVLPILLGCGIAGCLLYVSARWATFGRAFERQPAMAYVLLAGTGLLAVLAVTLVRRSSQPTAVVVVRLASLLPLAALSLPPGDGLPAWRGDLGHRLASAVTAGNDTFSATLVYDLLPNIVLYLPAGLVWTGVLGTFRRTLLTFTATSVAVELYQAAFTDRVCQVTDVVGNGFGAALGGALYVAARRWGPSPAPASSTAHVVTPTTDGGPP